MSETTLSASVRELVAALNGGDADTARNWCTQAAWEGGQVPLEPLCRDEHLLLQAAPLLLETEKRAAARLVGFREDKSRESIWLLFDKQADGWRCVEGTRTRLDAEGFLTGRRSPGDRPAAATPPEIVREVVPAPVDSGLLRAMERLVAALETADSDAGRALSEEGAWETRGESPSRLFKHVAKTPSNVGLLEWRVKGDRAAVHIGLSAAWGADDLWTVWRQRRGLGWKLVAAPNAWEPAGLFVLGRLDDVPSWPTLTADAGAARWGQAIIEASRTGGSAPEGVPAEAFAELGQAPESEKHELRLGETVSLPALGRAMVRLDVVETADEFVVDSRWAVLERGSSEAPWRFRRAVGMGSLVGLLDGIQVAWDAGGTADAPPLTEAEEASRRAVLLAVQEVLKANGLDPNALGVDKMSRDQLQAVLPQIVGNAFGALFATALSGILKDLGAAEPPEGTVDLDRERAKRAGVAVAETQLEKDLSREIRGAIRDAVTPAASKDGTARLDADFLKQSGPQLFGALFGAVAKAVAPANFTLDVKPKEGDPEGEPVKLQIPLGDILGQLFGAAANKPPANTPPAAPEPDEPDSDEKKS